MREERAECQNEDMNLKDCLCTYEPCERKAICCECILYHRKKNEIPGCLFPSNVEKEYDRSLRRFISCFK